MSAKVLKGLSIVLVSSMLLGLFACQPAPTATPAPSVPTDAPAATEAPEATEAPTQAPAENRVLKVWHYESDTGAMGKAWLAAKEEFEATHPGVTVEMDNSKGFEEIRQTASLVLNSDEADVMEYNKGVTARAVCSQQGLLPI
jgi:raffinose/stachyose/melibiose transport system substrate-binding protein